MDSRANYRTASSKAKSPPKDFCLCHLTWPPPLQPVGQASTGATSTEWPCLRIKSFNSISRALLSPSRLSRVLQGFLLTKSKQFLQESMVRVLLGGKSGFQSGRRLDTLKIIVIVLFQIRPKRKHLCWVRQICKGQKVI